MGSGTHLTLELVTDILFRDRGVPPQDFGAWGRLCVEFAGFQRVLGEFHCRMVQ